MSKTIKLGYEIETGKEISIDISHLLVTGITRLSGKTTTLEALIKRSKLKAVVFRTKIGEKGFIDGTIIPPFFKDKSDWQFIESLVEATLGERMRSWDRSKIIQYSKGTQGLLEFKKKIDDALLNEKIRAFDKDILTNLQAYLEIVLPKLQTIQFSNTLELSSGVNIIDLERFSRDSEVQSLIIRSVIEEVLHNFKGVIVVIPEFWKFCPQKRGNPCKQIIEEFVRQGATNNNYIWMDSQDMSGVDKIPLKQVSNWVLGCQSERNEVKHTLDQIPLPAKSKPKADEIMTLPLGHFYYCSSQVTKKVYVQPSWLDNKRAEKIALGKLNVNEIDAPEGLAQFKIAQKQIEGDSPILEPQVDFQETSKRFNKELIDIRTDFFNKIEDIQQQINKIASDIFELKNQPKQEINEEELISKILQKTPVKADFNADKSHSSFDKETLIKEVLARVPSGAKVYEIAPLEKITKDFLEEAKNHILGEISKLDDEEKKMLKFIESQERGCTQTMLIDKCLKLSATSGGNRSKISKKTSNMKGLLVVEKDKNAVVYPKLKDFIKSYLGTHEATEEEMENLYSHIIMEMLK